MDKKELAAIAGVLAYLLEAEERGKPQPSPWVLFVRHRMGMLRDPKTWSRIGGLRWG